MKYKQPINLNKNNEWFYVQCTGPTIVRANTLTEWMVLWHTLFNDSGQMITVDKDYHSISVGRIGKQCNKD